MNIIIFDQETVYNLDKTLLRMIFTVSSHDLTFVRTIYVFYFYKQ